jgi:hypothetical protein
MPAFCRGRRFRESETAVDDHETGTDSAQGGAVMQDAIHSDAQPGIPIEGYPGVRAGAFRSGSGLLGMLIANKQSQPAVYDPTATACPAGYTTRNMEVTGYTSGPESTGKRPGSLGYGIGKYQEPVGPGSIAAPPAYKPDTKMYVPEYGLGASGIPDRPSRAIVSTCGSRRSSRPGIGDAKEWMSKFANERIYETLTGHKCSPIVLNHVDSAKTLGPPNTHTRACLAGGFVGCGARAGKARACANSFEGDVHLQTRRFDTTRSAPSQGRPNL